MQHLIIKLEEPGSYRPWLFYVVRKGISINLKMDEIFLKKL